VNLSEGSRRPSCCGYGHLPWARLLFQVVLGICICIFSRVSYSADNSLKNFELRLAAARGDLVRVERLPSNARSITSEHGDIVAEWRTVEDGIVEEVQGNSALVTREKGVSQLEILVLYGENDLTEADISYVTDTTDARGRPGLELRLVEAASERLRCMTKANIGRHVVEILDGKVHAVLPIKVPVFGSIAVPGISTKEIREKAFGLSREAASRERTGRAPMISLPIWSVPVILVILGVLALAAFPVKGLRPAKKSKGWAISGASIGALLGAYLLGVTVVRTTSPLPARRVPSRVVREHSDTVIHLPEQESIVLLTETRLDILRLLLGGAAGAVAGIFANMCSRVVLHRAFFNAKRLSYLIIRRAWPAQVKES